ncbi:MAG: hypothetical protein IPK94_11715 [Saprospiraceae bacterium]|nr:hypothetical protein [Saprospiraceae bacterium]MBK8511941.1 hypothetical protein [Saprospiraceae bacterium]MBK9930539.1 hypothetical protein [Saprospiraceae bacterium]
MMLKIENNRVVTLRYKMTADSGKVLIDQLNGPPVEYIHGTGVIHPELEKPLLGLTEGSCRKIVIHDEKLGGTCTINVIIQGIREASSLEVSTGIVQESIKNAPCGPDCAC